MTYAMPPIGGYSTPSSPISVPASDLMYSEHNGALLLPPESESSRLERFIREEYEKNNIPLESISVAVQGYYTWCLKNGKNPSGA